MQMLPDEIDQMKLFGRRRGKASPPPGARRIG
jgi:hypothetical protein